MSLSENWAQTAQQVQIQFSDRLIGKIVIKQYYGL